ncbi:MAG: rhomboid family intramembrane serine protease [Alphaproteobacteria bacterium]|nr:MAG: rhomboid family intramembrane serine protease [Alphaproteobacteria bacterium]
MICCVASVTQLFLTHSRSAVVPPSSADYVTADRQDVRNRLQEDVSVTENDQYREPVFNVPPVTLYLVAVIFIVHLLLIATTPSTMHWVYQTFAFEPEIIAAVYAQAPFHGLLRLIVTLNTHLFLHHDWMHMIVNAGMLLAFGSLTERRFGPARYLILYFLAGYLGAYAEYLTTDHSVNLSLYGASAAVFGTMGAGTIIMAPRFGLRGVLIFSVVLLAINFVIGATSLGSLLVGGGAEIAWVAHMAGFFFGLGLALLYSLAERKTR